MTLRHVNRGDAFAITASNYNAFVDAALDFQRRQRGPQPHQRRPDSDTILVRNETGAEIDRFSVLGLGDPLILPSDNLPAFQDRIAMVGVAPTDSHTGKFCVLLEPLPDNGIGRACIDGSCVARVWMANEDDVYADIDPDAQEWLLSAGTGLARLLWVQPPEQRDLEEPEIAWALVRIGGGGGGATSTPVVLREIDEQNSILKVQKIKKKAHEPPEDPWEWSDGFETTGDLIDARPEPFIKPEYYGEYVAVGDLGPHTTMMMMTKILGLNVVIQKGKEALIVLSDGPFAQSEGAPHV